MELLVPADVVVRKRKPRGKPIVRGRSRRAVVVKVVAPKRRGPKPLWRSAIKKAQHTALVRRAYLKRRRWAAPGCDARVVGLLADLDWCLTDVARRLGCDLWLVRAWCAGHDRWGNKFRCPTAVILWLRRCVRSLARVSVPFS